MVDTRTLLQAYHFDVLKDMAELMGVHPTSGKKLAHINALAPFLFTPRAVVVGLALLGKREKETLATLQRTDERIEAKRLRLQLLRQGTVEPVEDNNRYGYLSRRVSVFAPEERRTSFPAVIGRLMAAGLVCGQGITYSYYTTRTKVHYDNVHMLYIPDSIRKLLPTPPPLPAPKFGTETPEQIQESSSRAFQRDLYFYWSTAHTTPLALTKNGRLYKRDLRLVNDALLSPELITAKDEPDYPRLIFLRLLLTDMGMLRRDGNAMVGVDDPRFLGARPTDRIQQAFVHWRDGKFWNELLSVPRITIVGEDSRVDMAPEQIAQARKTILEHIVELYRSGVKAHPAKASEDRWTSIAQLVDSVRMSDYGFLLPRDYSPHSAYYSQYYGYSSVRSPYTGYGNAMGWNISPRFEDEAEGWEVVEAGFILSMLVEPLHWMGLVDVGYTDERPVAYRLTQVGEWVLGLGHEVTIPEAEGKVIVQPNFEMFALDPISDLTLAKLDEFADRMTAERAIKYRLTRESVYRAQRNGWTAAQIMDTLNGMSDTPLPQNVARTMQEWQAIHERIKIHQHSSLLQAENSELIEQLIQNPRVKASLSTRTDETTVLIAPRQGETDELVRSLQASGYPPARTRSANEPLRPALTIDEMGQLHFTIALPSIYLYAQITPFTGRDERGRYFLTQSAVQEAIAGGMAVSDILGRLHKLHLGPLPRWVEIKVRAWGHYYGDAAVQTVTLVQFKDAKTLEEILAEPEMEGIVSAFAPDQDKALALVTGDVEALRRVFAERNIAAKEQLE